MVELKTAREVIDKLGGIAAVARLTGRKYNAAWNWTSFESFPSETYVVMTDALRAAGYTAPHSLWRMVASPESQEAS